MDVKPHSPLLWAQFYRREANKEDVPSYLFGGNLQVLTPSVPCGYLC